MRHLSIKQKNLLKKWQDTKKKTTGQDIMWYSELTEEQQNILDDINCFENLVSDVDRFLNDRYMQNWRDNN